jgi:hypothetical protein
MNGSDRKRQPRHQRGPKGSRHGYKREGYFEIFIGR